MANFPLPPLGNIVKVAAQAIFRNGFDRNDKVLGWIAIAKNHVFGSYFHNREKRRLRNVRQQTARLSLIQG